VVVQCPVPCHLTHAPSKPGMLEYRCVRAPDENVPIAIRCQLGRLIIPQELDQGNPTFELPHP
jgi:hypothetical protein